LGDQDFWLATLSVSPFAWDINQLLGRTLSMIHNTIPHFCRNAALLAMIARVPFTGFKFVSGYSSWPFFVPKSSNSQPFAWLALDLALRAFSWSLLGCENTLPIKATPYKFDRPINNTSCLDSAQTLSAYFPPHCASTRGITRPFYISSPRTL
jgi:hypothetical protein